MLWPISTVSIGDDPGAITAACNGSYVVGRFAAGTARRAEGNI